MSRDTNFHYSFLVLPAEKRRAIVAVWDFCRAVDDAVDESVEGIEGESLQRQIGRWRSELDRCYGPATPTTSEGCNLKPFVSRFNLSRQPFEDLLDGVAMDVTCQRYETFDELYRYCLRVASAVGLICIEIFGYRNKGTRDYAIALGVALQLTNIIRDVSIDFRGGRVYLPQEDLRRFQVTGDDLAFGISDRVADLLAFECERAQSFYTKSKDVLPLEDSRRLVAAEIMSGIYYAILERIKKRRYDVFSEVVRVPRSRRALIAARVWVRVMLSGSSM